MKKNRIIYIYIFIVLFWIMVMYNSWQTELVFKCGILIPVFTTIINFIVGKHMKVYCDEQEEYCQKNDSIKKYIMIENGTMFPSGRIELTVEIEDYFGNREIRTIVANSKPHTIRNFGMDMTFNHYGIMAVRIKRIRVFDFFFLTVYRKKMNVETKLYIFPDLEHRVKFQINRCQYQIEENETEESSKDGKGNHLGEITGADEYREGDDVRNIHWKLSSRSEELIVKHYSDFTDEKVYIHVDTLVDGATRYAECDKILGVLCSFVKFCTANNMDFRIIGYGDRGAFETDINNILESVGIRNENNSMFAYFLQQRKTAGTNIYITTEDVDRELIPDDMVYINIEDEISEDQKKYLIVNNTMIHLDVDNRTVQNQNKKFFIEPYNDKIRRHKKIKPEKDNFRYVVLMSFIALLASFLAIFSIYDVMFYEGGGITVPAVTVSIFIFIHFILNIAGDDSEEKKLGKVRNIIIFGGYLLIVVLGGVSFVFEGVSELIDAFRMDITMSENDYGFFEYTSDELEWLLILVSYAVVDVIYNFCMEFVLPVHLLIVLPLLSISMIVGYVPPAYAVLLGLIYFPAVFAINSCMRFGKKKSKKYLSDDYPYTGQIAVSSGIITIIVTIIVFLLVIINVFWGGYQRPVWMRQCKSAINSVLEAGSLNEGMQMISDLFRDKTIRTAGERGKLDDTVEVSYTGDTVLRVLMEQDQKNQDKSFYLKSYAGSDYTGISWKERSSEKISEEENYLNDIFRQVEYAEESEYLLNRYFTAAAAFREGLSYTLSMYQFMEEYFVATSLYWSEMDVTTLLKGDTNIYKPYFSLTLDQDIFGTDGYEYALEAKDRRTAKFHVCSLSNIVMTENVRKKYGNYPYISDDGERDETLKKILEVEKRYAEYVEQNYTEVPEELEGLKESFSDVTLVYQGKKVNLVNGGFQYRTLGYEPYVQYVRQYFQDNQFTYNINITRKNNEGDFIADFMRRKTGYCIHFASAAVMMFRSMGVPARYAEGYFVDEEDIIEEKGTTVEYEVTDKSAHAWVEIYQEGLGWVPVEVTPGTENFIVNYEEQEPETVQRNTARTDTNQQTSVPADESTSAGSTREHATAGEQNREEEQQRTEASSSPVFQDILRDILIFLAVITAFLMRYQVISSHHTKKLENKNKNIRLKETERQFSEMLRIFKIEMEEHGTNEVKAELLCNALREPVLQKEEALEAFVILDKCKYAPKGSVSREEAEKLSEFIKKYGQLMYTEGKVHEKFIYKYIKCLYLKSK